MLDGFHGQVNVELRPENMMGTRQFDVHQLTDRDFTEPGKMLERYEQLPAIQQQPEAVL